ncbi:MAG TPA: hypothetical protein VFE14_19840, partial [Micromonosporaceae bacterium]|nr:hypothetical protein [Micromonosporaceae bacterium]
MSTLEIVTLADRPEMINRVYDVHDEWPEFMGHDPLANALFNRVAHVFPEYCLLAVDADGAIAARARCVPFAMGTAGRERLPDGGLDRVVVWAFRDHDRGARPDTACAVDVTIASGYTGQGLS